MSIYSEIKTIAKKQGKSISQIEKDLNFSNGLIGKWNKAIPRADKLQAVANYLGVTPQYLMDLAERK
ncbi:helix-turn-helix domain-containing protein [Lactobacillus sp.]|uniref:helix-turn-helix domain-containing protein n=1 Tax=Lactobacillus sp. TaxID=1591 RepID=UPI0019996238|nr:helix-turn-helix domain-containing protein [Lactobacillus sp.]MBD5429318.1 helix-turn-helix transcriptional regulator [Lactobacillus sp.]